MKNVQFSVVSETQTFNNLTSAERSGAQCEVEMTPPR